MTALLRSSTDSSNEVISKVLLLASKISEDNQEFFKEFMVKLIFFFETDGVENNGRTGEPDEPSSGPNAISRGKVEFMIRRLCVSISAEKIFQTLSEVLVSFEKLNLEFVGNIVVTLNNILLTTHELQGLRTKLKILTSRSLKIGCSSRLFSKAGVTALPVLCRYVYSLPIMNWLSS